MAIDVAGLGDDIREAQRLASLETLTPEEERRFSRLAARIPALKSGMSRDEIDLAELNAMEERAGLSITTVDHSPPAVETRKLADWIRTGIIRTPDGQEQRNETIGHGPSFVGLSGGLASFAPTGFFGDIKKSLFNTSPLLSKENCTVQEVESLAAVLQIPFFSDSGNVAEWTQENTQESEGDITQVNADLLQTMSFRSPRIVFSLEAEMDIPDWLSICADILGQRLARGASPYLISGTGAGGQILGLLTSIVALGGSHITTAQGSSESTGGAQSSVNSIGNSDIQNLFFSLPEPYRNSSKAAFLMNSSTMSFLSRILDKQGHPLIDLQSERLLLCGKKVLIDEAMPSIGSAAMPIVFGDFSFWLTRIVTNGFSLRRYSQEPALIQQGAVAIRAFARVGGAMLSSDPINPPFAALINHS